MVEWRAVGADADRRAQRVIEIRTFDRDHRVAPRQPYSRKVAEEIRQPRQLRAGLVDRAAVVERLEFVELVQIGLERIRELVDEAGGGRDFPCLHALSPG